MNSGGASKYPIASWVARGSEFVFAAFDASLPYLGKESRELSENVRFVLGQLFRSCNATSESVFILLQADKVWDADILSRSVMEGTLKSVHMLSGGRDEIAARVHEYWEILPLFQSIRQNERASALLDEPLTPSNDRVVFTELQLTPSDVDWIRAEWPKSTRKMLEEAWSVSGILRSFEQSDSEPLKLLRHLAHGYGMSSHLLHKDSDAVGMEWERSRRDAVRNAAVTTAHSARLVSDQCAFARLRLHMLLRACGKGLSIIQSIDDRFKDLFDELRRASDHFHEIEYRGEGR